MPGRVLLATRSAGKRGELEPLLRAAGWDVVTLEEAGLDERPAEENALEVASTFAENALAKARYFHARSGLPALAEDSGLACDALDGAPGVHSKRWSGRSDLSGIALDAVNNERLLLALEGAPSRSARYVCVAAWVDDVRHEVARGETAGRILWRAEGTGGFGYDPLFWSEELGSSFGTVTREAKGTVSHRARAVTELLRKVHAGS